MKLSRLQKEFWPWIPPIGSKIRILQDRATPANEDKGAILTVIGHGKYADFRTTATTIKNHTISCSWEFYLDREGIQWGRV